MTIVIVRISDLFFSFEISCIERILEKKQEVVSVPLVPVFIEGIMNFQGRIITVINFAKLFKINTLNKSNLILISRQTKNLGFLVDEIVGFKHIDGLFIENVEPCEVFIDGYQLKSYILHGIFNMPVSFLNLSEIERFVLNPDYWRILNESESINL